MFRIIKNDSLGRTRIGEITTSHGVVPTPCFMPVGTRGLVKSLTSEELFKIGVDIMLANTYHLKLAASDIFEQKRLREINGWSQPILTDSGGFQVFSLGEHRKFTEDGVEFRHPLSGDKVNLTPESALDFQWHKIGADIAMCLDVCPPSEASYDEVKIACDLTTRWAQRTLVAVDNKKTKQQIFGICQGGVYEDLRRTHVQEITKINFDGFAIGGLAVGESPEKIFEALLWSLEYLPEDKPRYAMGVGDLEQMYHAIKMGVDMFDCVVPTREARHGRLYVWREGQQGTFFELGLKLEIIDITKTSYRKNFDLICADHPLPEVAQCSYAWLSYLFKINELLAYRIATAINLHAYIYMFKKIREQ